MDSVSTETVRRTLKKNDLKPWLKRYWVIPPDQDAEFVCAMEDVLEVYQRPYDPRRPQVCLDEASRQLMRETRTPMPAAPGRPATVDYEYERNGTANLFMMYEPLAGRRHVLVTERRTAKDYAHAIRYLLDDVCRSAETVIPSPQPRSRCVLLTEGGHGNVRLFSRSLLDRLAVDGLDAFAVEDRNKEGKPLDLLGLSADNCFGIPLAAVGRSSDRAGR